VRTLRNKIRQYATDGATFPRRASRRANEPGRAGASPMVECKHLP
jgi:hypothetical protein